MEKQLNAISEFVDELFRDETGIVYAPTKAKVFNQKFFRWPEQKAELIRHLSDIEGRDVYLSPMLFTDSRVHPSTFKGTFHLWSEFDGNAPTDPSLPPTIRIQSGKEGYEHWYWRLEDFTTDVKLLEGYAKRIAYALDADLSVWDYAVILRPPSTFNHKRHLSTKLLEKNQRIYPLQAFSTLPEVPNKLNISIDLSSLPKLDELLIKYPWNEDAYDLFTKPIEEIGNKTGHRDRSAAMCRLAVHCADAGMSNEDIYVIIDHVDNNWKKFTGRDDRDRRLQGIIAYARSKQAIRGEILDEPIVYRFKDFMETEIQLKWVITGLLPVAGSAVIFGPSSVGKSTFILRLLIAIATGQKEFLGWTIERTQRVLFTSLEMTHDELKHFISQMNLTEDQMEKLQENFFVWPIGHPYPFDTPDQQIEVKKYIDRYNIDLITIDSLGEASFGSISKQDDMKKLYSFLNQDLRKDRKCGYFFVHHPRKSQDRGSNPQGFDDVYGDSYIVNRAQTVIMLADKGPTRVEVSVPKSRLSLNQSKFILVRQPDRSFTVAEKKETRAEIRNKEVFEDSPGILGFGGGEIY